MHTDLIPQALVIGAAEAAVYWTVDGLRALQREGDSYVDCSRQANLLLDCSAEKRLYANVSQEQLESYVSLWSRRQGLLHWLIAGMDSGLSKQTRRLGLELADKAAGTDSDAFVFARARLLSCPLEEAADLDGALVLANDLPEICGLYQKLAAARAFIEPVSRALRELVYFDFPSKAPGDEAYRALIDRGVIAEAVSLLADGEPSRMDGLVLNFGHDGGLKALCPRLPHLLTAFCKKAKTLSTGQASTPKSQPSFEQVTEKAEPVASKEDPILRAARDFLDHHGQTRTNRTGRRVSANQAKAAVDKQKQFIISMLNKGRLGEVEQAVINLMHNQARDSKPEHLCKSLCDLGARFTDRGQFELAGRVYVAASLVEPSDPVSLTGSAERLRKIGKLDDALAIYREAQQRFTNDAFCFNGYAETLRDLGRLDEALTAYREAQQRFTNDAFCFTGYAETLRDRGDTTGAIEVYSRLIEHFPGDRVISNALACLSLQLDSSFDAETFLSLDKMRTESDWRDYHVLAMAKARRGFWDEAEKMLSKGMQETPFAQQREVFETSLTFVLLHCRRTGVMQLIIPPVTAEKIIRFPLRAVLQAHASAIEKDNYRAEQWLEQAQHSSQCRIIVLADHIRRHYGLNRPMEASPELERKIEEMEFSLLLRAAA